jgi:3-methyladenine DNA glycosylase AlkD
LNAAASTLRRRVRSEANPSHAAVARRYFKTGPGEYAEGDQFLGVRVPALRRLAREYAALPRPEILKLLRSRWHEERLLALLLLVRQYGRAGPADRDAIYRLYMANRARVDNWDLVDSSAEHILGAHVWTLRRSTLARLARSRRVWDRRMAIMATFHDVKRGRFDETLRLARILIDDPHHLVHKAVGWMLREIGKRDRRLARRFLDEHAGHMPPTMLRYAIERFPGGLRRRYLAAGAGRPRRRLA